MKPTRVWRMSKAAQAFTTSAVWTDELRTVSSPFGNAVETAFSRGLIDRTGSAVAATSSSSAEIVSSAEGPIASKWNVLKSTSVDTTADQASLKDGSAEAA